MTSQEATNAQMSVTEMRKLRWIRAKICKYKIKSKCVWDLGGFCFVLFFGFCGKGARIGLN